MLAVSMHVKLGSWSASPHLGNRVLISGQCLGYPDSPPNATPQHHSQILIIFSEKFPVASLQNVTEVLYFFFKKNINPTSHREIVAENEFGESVTKL